MKKAMGLLTLALLAISISVISWSSVAHATGSLTKVNHIIIVMQENHSFDNYFGVLGYQAGGHYHTNPGKPCLPGDNTCVNGLACTRSAAGEYGCVNSNPENDGGFPVHSFHDTNYCPAPDLQHNWPGSHQEGNYQNPNDMIDVSPNNGFVIVNDQTEQTDTNESYMEDDTMGFYDGTDLPYYYALAQAFALDDQYFCDVVGPTIPNRFYLMAATSFGHLTTNELVPPPGGYKPITGTIFDLLDKAGVNWVDYYTDVAQGGDFRVSVPPHFMPIATFFKDAAAGTLPPVAFVDPELAGVDNLATDEHPPHDIRSGEYYVAQVINAVHGGPNWKDSVIFLTYDEHGGFYDHVKPATANQNGALTPDGIAPGQCADLSNPPTSTEPGMGANCSQSQADAKTLCPAFTPTGRYPADCANFNQLGFRVPFVAISPFSKPHYVSHTIGNHASILKMIEKRFLNGGFLTLRDEYSNDLEDLFDFTHAPSLHTNVPSSLAPAPNLLTDGNGSCAAPATSASLP